MHPILFKIGPFTIYSYGFMVALGFAVSAVLIHSRAPKFGVKGDMAVDYLIIMLLSGITGARIFYVLLNLPYFAANPLAAVNLSQGGLVWYGGFIAAFLASFWFVARNKVEFWTLADLVAPSIALGQAFGRIGCFLNGCCYGIAGPKSSLFCDRHPVQIYSAALLFIIFAVLLLWQGRRRFTGEIFLGYCILYSGKRFLIEFLRGDNSKIFAGLTIAQLISVLIFAVTIYLFKRRLDTWKIKRYSE